MSLCQKFGFKKLQLTHLRVGISTVAMVIILTTKIC
jgi:hypothetical protein